MHHLDPNYKYQSFLAYSPTTCPSMSMKYLLAHFPGVHIWSLLLGGKFCRISGFPSILLSLSTDCRLLLLWYFAQPFLCAFAPALTKLRQAPNCPRDRKRLQLRVEQCEKEAHSFHLFVSHSVPTPWVSLHLATSTNRQTAPDGGESGVELEQEEQEEEEEEESSNQPRTLPCPRWSWSRTRASCNFIPSVVHWVLGCRAGFGPDLYLFGTILDVRPFWLWGVS